jgi:hypothetical protein
MCSYAQIGKEYIFKPTIGNENLHEISHNGVTLVTFAISKKLHRQSTMFLHRNIHKYTWTYPDEKTQNQIDHILVDRHSNILDVRSYRAADCDTDHYLVVARIRERLAVNNQRSHRFHMERFK